MRAELSIVIDPKNPGSINSPHDLILFDGVCATHATNDDG
jgi:hypothetical protein